jgi:hypothetical protein
MSTTAAAQLAQLRTRFPEWAIIRTRCGIFIARHQITGQRVTAHTLTELENRLTGWGTHR